LASNGVADVRVAGLTKRFGDVVAVDAIDLEIARGEFFTMLGPSGSGKTTTLRMIAGFEIPDEGAIELAGEDVSGLPPYSYGLGRSEPLQRTFGRFWKRPTPYSTSTGSTPTTARSAAA